MAERAPGYIVVEGPIGVGKTTLARKLAASYGTDLMLEMAFENPFLDKFYQDRKTAALPTQLYFLFQRVRQIEALKQTDMFRPVRVADFLMQKDRLFAEVNLSEHELSLYNEVYDRLTLEIPVPDLVIYLQAPVENLLQRIHERGISYEQSIDEDYLNSISKAYIDFFYHYNESPLLIVNTMDFNLADECGNLELLLEQIRNHHKGRQYFNPKEL
ncbi:MAG: deoxynucleoside kinase [Thiotrichales bacterium]|nr:deoxynucleoside kinase [Thiotrichales bacterium]